MTNDSPPDDRELALHVLRKLREAGYLAYWAGGCVRDQLLSRTPNDYDVATNATPAQIRAVFGRRRTLEIGVAFGVIAVRGPARGQLIEVTTFRRDATYSDGRHPDAVVFSTPEEDAQRRDFTINGLFYDPLEDRVIDYVGGVADLDQGLVRAIGDPRARFSEDKLRMLRAVRITAGFGFALDAATEAAIVEMAATIHVVSPERIAQEMHKILVGSHRVQAVDLLERTGLLAALLPELPAIDSDEGTARLARTRTILGALESPEFPLALAALVSGIGKRDATVDSKTEVCTSLVDIAAEVCQRWRLSNKDRDRILWLVEHQDRLTGASTLPWSAVQPLLAAAGGADLIAWHAAHAQADGVDATTDLEYCRARLAWPAGRLNPPPLLTGTLLEKHGIPPGPIYKALLQRVRDAQLDGQVSDVAQALQLVEDLLKADENDSAVASG